MTQMTEHDWQTFEDALRDPEPWLLADMLSAPPPDPSKLRALAAKLDSERAAARELLAPVLESLAAFQAASIETDPRYHSRGVIDVLNETARPLRNTQPLLALAAADAAVSIATRLAAVDDCPQRVLGTAHVERAWALFFIGRYRDTEAALRQADLAFDADARATDWDRAHVSLVRATVYLEMHQLDEASEEALSAAAAFDSFGDQKYYLTASIIEGHVLFFRGDHGRAAKLLDRIAAQTDDPMVKARVRHSAGNCYIELGDLEKAESYLLEAYALWSAVGLEVECVRAGWSLGVLARAKGDLDEALARIDGARAAYEALGIVNDAAIARLELAEVLLLADRAEEVPDVLRDVVVSFTSEGVMRNASLALAYLREAVEAGAVEARLIRHVRTYLEDLPADSERIFQRLS
jgi:tetratricopeptide (TPR) repeat protein